MPKIASPPSKAQDMSREVYGRIFPPVCDSRGRPVGPLTDAMIELKVLSHHEKWMADPVKKVGLLPWKEHFKRLVSATCDVPDSVFPFTWNPNAERILDGFVEHKYLAVAGHASSSKTQTMAAIGVFFWLIDPFNTKVLFTSLTAKSSKGKIWGSVTECWQQICRRMGGEAHMPGKLLASQNIIKFRNAGVMTEKAGIELVVGESSRAKESAEKLQGYKRGKMLLMADELATLEKSLLDTALTNLTANDQFRMIGGFNPDSYFDPGGVFSKPKDGWHSINENSSSWETIIEPYGLQGFCIRFDAEQSPNVVAAKDLWPGLITLKYLNELKNAFGEKTKSYWKMVRGYWSPTGSADCIYSEADIINYRGNAPVNNWLEPPVKVAGLDPAFSHGGDAAALAIGRVGLVKSPDTNDIQRVFELTNIYRLGDDVTVKSMSRSELTVKDLKRVLNEHKIPVQNLGIDTTGGGDPFSSLVARELGSGFLSVQFAGDASDKVVSKTIRQKGRDRFKNKVTELWMVGRELLRTGQLRGILPDVITDLTSRTFEGDGDKVKVAVEPKTKMKLRTHRSPDYGDALFVAIDVARQRLGLASTEKGAVIPKTPKSTNPMAEMFAWGQKKRPAFESGFQSVEMAGSGWGD